MNEVLVSEKNLKKRKVTGEIAFALISLFHVQVQEPVSRSTTTRAFVFFQNLQNFIITKYLILFEIFKNNDKLTVCVNEHVPCGLSITRDIKICQYHMIYFE